MINLLHRHTVTIGRVRQRVEQVLLYGFLALGLAVSSAARAQPPHTYIVVDGQSGQVLQELNADTRSQPASLTKMLTLYLVFEALTQGRLRLDQRLQVSAHAASMPSSRLGLRKGQTIALEDAVLAVITKSANDVAVVLAEGLGGTESEFARMMNDKARLLGMLDSSFCNASGLPDPQQFSTARDMLRLGLALMRDFPQHYPLFSVLKFSYKGRAHWNHNRLLGQYAGSDGIKTGYVRASGFNLVASAKRHGQRLVAVVFGGKSARGRDRHMMELLDAGFVKLAQGWKLTSVGPGSGSVPSNP